MNDTDAMDQRTYESRSLIFVVGVTRQLLSLNKSVHGPGSSVMACLVTGASNHLRDSTSELSRPYM